MFRMRWSAFPCVIGLFLALIPQLNASRTSDHSITQEHLATITVDQCRDTKLDIEDTQACFNPGENCNAAPPKSVTVGLAVSAGAAIVVSIGFEVGFSWTVSVPDGCLPAAGYYTAGCFARPAVQEDPDYQSAQVTRLEKLSCPKDVNRYNCVNLPGTMTITVPTSIIEAWNQANPNNKIPLPPFTPPKVPPTLNVPMTQCVAQGKPAKFTCPGINGGKTTYTIINADCKPDPKNPVVPVKPIAE